MPSRYSTLVSVIAGPFRLSMRSCFKFFRAATTASLRLETHSSRKGSTLRRTHRREFVSKCEAPRFDRPRFGSRSRDAVLANCILSLGATRSVPDRHLNLPFQSRQLDDLFLANKVIPGFAVDGDIL